MEKSPEERLARCPVCGRTISYKTKADKKRERDSAYYSSDFYYHLGTIYLIGVVIAIIAISGGILYLAGVFNEGFLDGIGKIGMFFVNIIWTVLKFIANIIWSVIKFIGTSLWNGITWLVHRVFG